MSRVDRALRAWEKRDTTPDPPERFELREYGHESVNGTRAPAPPPVESRPAANFRIPTDPAGAASNGHRSPKVVSTGYTSPDLDARLVTGSPGAVSLEQYRRLAAVLHDIQAQQGLRTLMLTSALPAEGKTLTTVNLALTLSESYERRVLVIDADLRWPSLHKAFGVANDAGLSEALQAEGAEPAIVHVSPRLAVLTAGKPGSAPLAGLTSARMAALIATCAEQFDWVLLDTPPVGLLPDAQLLARLTRAVVFVIAAGVTPSATVERAIAELGPDCVIGTVLNRVEDRRIPQAGYYSRYYGYGSDE
jgi:protein-tyrosine kinase